MQILSIRSTLHRGRVKEFSVVLLSILALLALATLSSGVAFAAQPSINFDQCANGSTGDTTCTGGWITGNLNHNNSRYPEGTSVPQRITFSNLDPNTTYTISISWAILTGGEHAYDYLKTYNTTVTGADPCTGTGAACGTVSTVAIPNPGYIDNCKIGGFTFGQAFYGVTPVTTGNFTFFGDVNTLSVGAYTVTTCPPASGALDNGITLSLKTGATAGTVVLSYASHVAATGDWGSGNGAGSISGSPYHNHVTACTNIGGCGSQDNQLQSDAVIPAPLFSTQVKRESNDANIGDPPLSINKSTQFYDSGTLSFGNTAQGAIQGTVALFYCYTAGTTATPCSSGGTSITVQGGGTINVTPPATATFRSNPITPTLDGVYCFRLEFTSTNTNYTSFKSASTPGECVLVSTPTFERLQLFGGVAHAKSVRLSWLTSSELDVAGFNVWRSSTRNGIYEKLNPSLISSLNPGEMTGASYIYRDKTALAGQKYFYKLEVVGGTYTLEWSGIVRVRKPLTQ